MFGHLIRCIRTYQNEFEMFVSIPGVSLAPSTPVKSVKSTTSSMVVDVSDDTTESPLKQQKKGFGTKYCDIPWCEKPDKNAVRATYIVVHQKSILLCKLGHFKQPEEAAKLASMAMEFPPHVVAPFKCWWCGNNGNNLFHLKSKKNSALDVVKRLRIDNSRTSVLRTAFLSTENTLSREIGKMQ
jgi:hypothetical protein